MKKIIPKKDIKKPIVIANWKMNLSLKQRGDLAFNFKNKIKNIDNKDIVVCPSVISLMQVGEIIRDGDIQLGAQDIFWEETGAYTGEISPAILYDLNCRYAIVGHSERRQYLGETDEMINKKIDACLENNIIPIFCIGETMNERHNNQTDNILLSQIRKGLAGIDVVGEEKIVVAYEPVWAIGSGQVVTPEELERVLKLIRQSLINIYPLTIVNNNVRIIYGGSVNPDNVLGFSKLDLLDGFLVGGASLNVDQFNKIIKAL